MLDWCFDQILSGEKPWSSASPDQSSLWIKHRGSHCSDIQGILSITHAKANILKYKYKYKANTNTKQS